MTRVSLVVATVMMFAVPIATADARTAPVSETDRAQYSLIDVTEPEMLRPSALDHVRELRKSYGLRSGADFVRRLHAHPARFDAVRSTRGLWASLIVTPEDLPRLQTHRVVAAGAHAYANGITEMLGAANAGTFVDGNRYVVQCARCDVDDVNARLDALGIAGIFRDSIIVREVRYSLEDLEGAHDEAVEILASRSLQTDGSGSNWMKNRVEVYVGRSSERQVRQQLRKEFSPNLVTAVRVPGVAEKPDGGFRSSGPPTWFGAARTDGDRGIVVSFTGSAPVTDPNDACQYDYRATADERNDEVRVTVRPVYRAAHREPVSCTDEGYGRTANVTLQRPLGTRRLVDGATGDSLPVFDGSILLEPGWLPSGWRVVDEGGSGLGDPDASWTRAFGAPTSGPRRECPHETDFVRLHQAVGTALDRAIRLDQYAAISSVEVRGTIAEIRVDPRGQRTVVHWQEAGQQLVLESATPCAGVPGLDLDTLTRIAQGLR